MTRSPAPHLDSDQEITMSTTTPDPREARLTEPSPQDQATPSEELTGTTTGAGLVATAPSAPQVRGAHWELIIVGILGLISVTFGLTRRVLNLDLDWGRVTTLGLISVGLLVAVIGLVGVLRRQSD